MTTERLKSLISVLLCLIMQLNALTVYASAKPVSSITPRRFTMVDTRTLTNEFEGYKRYSKYLQLLKTEMDAIQLMDVNVKNGVHLTEDEKNTIIKLFKQYNSASNSDDAINDFLRMRQIDLVTKQYDPEGLLYLLDNMAQIYTFELVDFKNAEINNRKARTQYEKLLRMGIDKLPVSDFYNSNRMLYNSFFNTPADNIPNGFRHPANRIDLVTSLPDSHLSATRLMDFENVGARIKQRSELLASKLSEQKLPKKPVSANPETISKALRVYESFCFGIPQYGAFQSNYLLAAETYAAFKSTGNTSYLQQIIRFGENAIKAKLETTLENQEAVNLLHYWLGRAYLLSGSKESGIINIEAFLTGIDLHEKMLGESIEHKKDIAEKAKQEAIDEIKSAEHRRTMVRLFLTITVLGAGAALAANSNSMSNIADIFGNMPSLVNMVNTVTQNFMKSADVSVLQAGALAKFITPYSLKVNRYFDKYEMIDYFVELGNAYQSVGSIDKALENHEEAVNIIERQRSTIFKEEQRISFSATKQRLYSEIISLFVSKGSYDKALEYIERAKSRAFVDLMGSTKIKLKSEKLTKLYDNNVINNIEMDALVSNRKIGYDQIDELFRKYKRGLTINEKVTTETTEQELSSLSNVQTLSSAAIKQLAVADTAILEYYLTEDRVHICLIQDNNVNVVTLKVNISDIIEKASLLKERIINQGDDKSVAQYFHKLLIAPVEAKIKSKQLIIVPHNVLHYLPFQAFFDGNQYLIEKYAISYTPSATILKLLEQKQTVNNGKALVIGNPTGDLRFAESEAVTVSKLFKESKLLTGNDASETFVKNNAANYEFIHLASHGKYDEQNPLNSAIMLSPDKDNDGVLTTAELFAAKWQASLVTLSACETGLSKYRTGDELVGLQRGLMFAGARSVVLSLWMVDDKATGSLMDGFYRHLSSMPKNRALQKAQIDAMKQYSKPYFWAAFNLAGVGI